MIPQEDATAVRQVSRRRYTLISTLTLAFSMLATQAFGQDNRSVGASETGAAGNLGSYAPAHAVDAGDPITLNRRAHASFTRTISTTIAQS